MVAALAALSLLLGPNWAVATEIVVPSARAFTVGNAFDNDAFGCDHSVRYQQVYRGSELGLGPTSISEIAFPPEPTP